MARYEVHQTDGNAKRLYAYAEALGMSVAILNRPVDAAVGFQGISAVVEVKRPGEKLRPKQLVFLGAWNGLAAIWRTEADVDALRDRMIYLAKRGGFYGRQILGLESPGEHRAADKNETRNR